MSAAPRYPANIGYNGLRMTADEYLAIGETPERYELIDGVVFMSPSPTPNHQSIALLIAAELLSSARAVPGVRVIPDVDLVLTSKRVYRPDISVYAPGRLARLPDRLTLPPDLIIEVLSPSSRPMDLITKREDYQAFGVAEYWAVDPEDITLRRWTRSGDKLIEQSADATAISCVSIPGVVLDLAKVRAAM